MARAGLKADRTDAAGVIPQKAAKKRNHRSARVLFRLKELADLDADVAANIEINIVALVFRKKLIDCSLVIPSQIVEGAHHWFAIVEGAHHGGAISPPGSPPALTRRLKS